MNKKRKSIKRLRRPIKKIIDYRNPPVIADGIPINGGVHPKSYYYQHASQYGLEAINLLVMLMRECKNPFVRLHAAKTLLNKTIPDLKAVEITGDMTSRAMIVVKSYGEGDIVANTVKQIQIDNEKVEEPITSDNT